LRTADTTAKISRTEHQATPARPRSSLPSPRPAGPSPSAGGRPQQGAVQRAQLRGGAGSGASATVSAGRGCARSPCRSRRPWARTRPPPSTCGWPRNPLLLLHGFGASATWQWAPYLRALIAAGFDPIVPDLVFFGASPTAPTPSRPPPSRPPWTPSGSPGSASSASATAASSATGWAPCSRRPSTWVALVCAGVCLEEKDLAEGLFPVTGVEEATALLVPRRPEEVRRLVRLIFVRPPLIMPSCFLWDYIRASRGEFPISCHKECWACSQILRSPRKCAGTSSSFSRTRLLELQTRTTRCSLHQWRTRTGLRWASVDGRQACGTQTKADTWQCTSLRHCLM
ncbi:uncharacterized protein, partial [Miscanthus floridulus]|uniref:uncharacterized protein n=1 Tax=Miscanthus floridulus TaxID=154761 RepID=UPI003458F4BE